MAIPDRQLAKYITSQNFPADLRICWYACTGFKMLSTCMGGSDVGGDNCPGNAKWGRRVGKSGLSRAQCREEAFKWDEFVFESNVSRPIFSRRRRTYIRVPNTDLGYLGFRLLAVTLIFGFLKITSMWIGGNGVRAHHPRRHHSLRTCSRDGFEGFDKNYCGAQNFHRPTLKLHCLT